jgi:HEPN domain-containing protein
MEEVDSELRASQVPITARNLKCFKILRRHLGITEEIPLSNLPDNAREGIYEGDDLTVRVFRWFDERYGDKPKIKLPGQTFVVIRGDPYRVRLPFVVGQIGYVADPYNMGNTKPMDVGRPVLNVLDLVVDLSPSLAASIPEQEFNQLLQDIVFAIEFINRVVERKTLPELVGRARGDIASSVDDVLRSPSDFGASRWHSLQAAEKFMKALLGQRGVKYRWTHDLRELSGPVLPFVRIPDALISEVNCRPDVRYDGSSSSLESAHRAHRSMIRICDLVLKRLRQDFS